MDQVVFVLDLEVVSDKAERHCLQLDLHKIEKEATTTSCCEC